MSIGIVSLTTMFPLSVLRSIKASQLTHAADLRYNVESNLDLFDTPVSGPVTGNSFINNAFTALSSLPANQQNSAGLIIDPIGYHSINSAFFGTTPVAPPHIPALPFVYHGGTDNNLIPNDSSGLPTRSDRDQLAEAEHLATLPDSWVTVFEYSPAGGIAASNIVSLNVPGLAVSGFTMPTSGSARVVLFDADVRSNQARTITNFNAGTDTIDWIGPLPTNYNSNSVRIETQEARYSWLLTMRKVAAAGAFFADIDVVVFFRRPYSTDATSDLSGNQLYSGTIGSGRTIRVQPDPAQPKPFIKPGNYMFDTANLVWYQIRAAQPVPASNNVDIVLDRTPIVGTPTNANRATLMFPRAVIDVYPIGRKRYR